MAGAGVAQERAYNSGGSRVIGAQEIVFSEEARFFLSVFERSFANG